METLQFGVDMNAKYVCKIWLDNFYLLKNKVYRVFSFT